MDRPKQIIAEIMDRIVDRPGHNMLAHEIVKKLDAGGYVIAPKEPTAEMITAGLIPTAAWQNIQGSALTVNREKMRMRYEAMISALTPTP